MRRAAVGLLAGALAPMLPAAAAPLHQWTKVNNAAPGNSNTSGTDGRIPNGSTGSGDSLGVLGVSVIKEGATYRMWYGGRGADSAWRIYHATSSNGLTWLKYNNTAAAPSDQTGTDGRVPLGLDGAGDDAGALYPAVVKRGDAYHMWYDGYDGAAWRGYHASSPDGLTWTKSDNSTPDNSDTNSANGRIPLGVTGGDSVHILGSPVIVENGAFRMWYGASDGSYRGYYATSANGLAWSKANNTPSPVSDTTSTTGRVALGSAPAGDDVHARPGAVIQDDATYRMWYNGYDDTNASWHIYTATSPDGLTWTKFANLATDSSDGVCTNGVIPRGVGGSGDDVHAIAPAVIRDGTTYRMWYSGYDGARWRIYHATYEPPYPTIVNSNAANVTAAEADLVGYVAATGDAPAQVSVYWGTTNGGCDKAAWATNAWLGTNGVGALTNGAASLAGATRYYYSFYATNAFGDDWADDAASFSTVGAPSVDNAGGATAVTDASATLRGEVLGGNPTPDAYVFWGPTDGVMDKAAWSNVVEVGAAPEWTFDTAISGLLASQTYSYRCYASNSLGSAWAAATTNFTTAAASLSIDNPQVVEGPDFTSTNMVFTLTLSATSAVNVTVDFGTSNGTAAAGTDYVASNGTATIAAGTIATSVTVVVNGDVNDEFPSQSLWLVLSNVVNAAVADGSGQGVIVDDDDAPETRVWTGTGSWAADIGNWSPTGQPGPLDDVIVKSGTVTLSNAVTVASLIVSNSAKLDFENWNSTLAATGSVTIRSNGVVAAVGPFVDTAMSNNICFICSDLLLEAGGTITADGKGYQRGLQGNPAPAGNGPGGGAAYDGGQHGGVGGIRPLQTFADKTYGSATAPVAPGSGGGGSIWGQGGDGGGAIRINVSGTATISGDISADGLNRASGSRGGSGSGGSVYITCNLLAGTNGTVSANGGSGVNGDWGYGGGGGGRIAVVYNPVAQAAAPLPDVIFSALGGRVGPDPGDLGTVYFPDKTLIANPWRHSGQFVGPVFTNLAIDSLTLDNVWLRFPADGFQLTVTNSLAVVGSAGRLDLGGSARLVNWKSYLSSYNLYNASNGIQATVGGSLTVDNGGELFIFSGVTNVGGDEFSARLQVVGNTRIGTNSTLTSVSHPTNGGSALFNFRRLAIDAGGVLDADGVGFAGARATSPYVGYGPGAGIIARGAGYGGEGGDNPGSAYGSSNAPVGPGSGGGGSSAGGSWGGFGGGSLRVFATLSVTVNGTISANGRHASDVFGIYGGGGSGGAIYIRCSRFAGSGTIQAKGGRGGDHPVTAGGGGGAGGRIAIWRIADTTGGAIEPNVEGGTGDRDDGDVGTVFWGWLASPGTMVLLQ